MLAECVSSEVLIKPINDGACDCLVHCNMLLCRLGGFASTPGALAFSQWAALLTSLLHPKVWSPPGAPASAWNKIWLAIVMDLYWFKWNSCLMLTWGFVLYLFSFSVLSCGSNWINYLIGQDTNSNTCKPRNNESCSSVTFRRIIMVLKWNWHSFSGYTKPWIWVQSVSLDFL